MGEKDKALVAGSTVAAGLGAVLFTSNAVPWLIPSGLSGNFADFFGDLVHGFALGIVRISQGHSW
jgi:hypothetical protein